MCFIFRLGAQLTKDKLGSLAELRISERTTPLSTPEFTECQQLHLFPELKCSDSDRDTTRRSGKLPSSTIGGQYNPRVDYDHQ